MTRFSFIRRLLNIILIWTPSTFGNRCDFFIVGIKSTSRGHGGIFTRFGLDRWTVEHRQQQQQQQSRLYSIINRRSFDFPIGLISMVYCLFSFSLCWFLLLFLHRFSFHVLLLIATRYFPVLLTVSPLNLSYRMFKCSLLFNAFISLAIVTVLRSQILVIRNWFYSMPIDKICRITGIMICPATSCLLIPMNFPSFSTLVVPISKALLCFFFPFWSDTTGCDNIWPGCDTWRYRAIGNLSWIDEERRRRIGRKETLFQYHRHRRNKSKDGESVYELEEGKNSELINPQD